MWNGAAGRNRREILIGGIAHETNVFSRVPTDFEQFRQRIYITGREMIAGFSGTRTVVGGFLDGLALLDATPLPLIYASATPGGIVTRAAYARLASVAPERHSQRRGGATACSSPYTARW